MALQLRNTTGRQGYVTNNNQNMYNVLNEGYNTDSCTKRTVAMQTATITQTAAMTTGSTLGNTYGATIPSEMTNAIKQLTAKQTAIMTQMSAMSFSPPPPQTQAAANYHVSPIQQLNIPTFAGQANVSFNAGTGIVEKIADAEGEEDTDVEVVAV